MDEFLIMCLCVIWIKNIVVIKYKYKIIFEFKYKSMRKIWMEYC